MPIANPAAIFDFADQIALVSSEVLRFRIKNKHRLTDEQKNKLEGLEIELDQATERVRANGIAALAQQTKAARDQVEAATTAAESLLRRVKLAERAVKVATSVLGLALAALVGNPMAILAAAKDVMEVVDNG